MVSVDPGWYPDGSGLLRYWDGQAWTEHVQAPAAPVVPAPADPAPTREIPIGGAPGLAGRGLSGGQIGALVGAGVLALAGIGLMLVPTLTSLGSDTRPAPASLTSATGAAEPTPDAGVTDDGDVTPDPTVEAAVAVEVGEITADSAPSEVAIAWAAAWNANDCATEHRLSAVELTWGMTEEDYCEGIVPTGDEPVLVGAEVLEESVTADTAEVSLLETVDWGDGWTSDSTTVYTLILTDEGWRVSEFEWIE